MTNDMFVRHRMTNGNVAQLSMAEIGRRSAKVLHELRACSVWISSW
jgi:hypothetical protein